MRRFVTLAVVLGSLSRGHCAKKLSALSAVEPLTPNLEMVYMEPDRMEGTGEQRLAIYCYPGQYQTWKDTFLTVNVNVDCMGKKCSVYLGKQSDEILRHWTWGVGLVPLTGPNHSIKMDPFNPSCVGVEAATPYSIELVVYQVDKARLASFVIGNFIVHWGHKVFMHLFYFLAYWVIIAFIVAFNVILAKWLTKNGDENFGHNATKNSDFWLFYISINVIENELFKRIPPRVADTLIRMLARLLLLGVGNFLVNWGINNHGPTMVALAGLRAVYHEIFN